MNHSDIDTSINSVWKKPLEMKLQKKFICEEEMIGEKKRMISNCRNQELNK
jgi:hypothetical protein